MKLTFSSHSIKKEFCGFPLRGAPSPFIPNPDFERDENLKYEFKMEKFVLHKIVHLFQNPKGVHDSSATAASASTRSGYHSFVLFLSKASKPCSCRDS